MKRYAFLTLLVLCFCPHFSPAAWADPAAQARKQIQAAYNSQNAAMSRKDMKGATAHIDPAYVGRGKDGTTQSYKGRISGLPQLFAQVKTIGIRTTIQKFKMAGPTTALVEAVSRMTLGADDPTTHKPASASFVYMVHDKWTKRPKGWMLIQTFELGRTRVK